MRLFGRTILLSAALLYALVLALILLPSGSSSDHATAATPTDRATASVRYEAAPYTGSTQLPFRSFTMQIQRTDWIDRYIATIDRGAEMGFDTVLLVVDPRQEDGTSTRIYLDLRMTPTADKLGDLIKHAKSKNLRVIIMPIVLLDDPKGNEWRGTLKPDSWDTWFDSYRELIGWYAWVAQSNNADMLVVGSELVSSETHVDQWERTIAHVRKTFKGRLTYSSNWDHYTAVKFWDKLDLIGMNSYWKLGESRDASVDEIVSHWKDIQTDLLAFQKKTKKPLMFLEAGWCSLANAATEPWDYTRTEEDADVELQKRLFEGFFKTWYGHPALGGFSVWEFIPDPPTPAASKDDKSYTPENKPAEQVIRNYLSKGPWKVGS